MLFSAELNRIFSVDFLNIKVDRVATNSEATIWWLIIMRGSFKFVFKLSIPKVIWDIKSKKAEIRNFQLFLNKSNFKNETNIIDMIDIKTGIANNLWEFNTMQFWFIDKHRCADHVEESLTPITDWTKVRERGIDKRYFHQRIFLSIALFIKAWFT